MVVECIKSVRVFGKTIIAKGRIVDTEDFIDNGLNSSPLRINFCDDEYFKPYEPKYKDGDAVCYINLGKKRYGIINGDAEEIYATEDVLGRRLITRIQMGLFDVADGEISEIKVVDGQIYFHWNFYDGGWYTRDGLLREEARKLIDGITDKEILIGINRCKNGKK